MLSRLLVRSGRTSGVLGAGCDDGSGAEVSGAETASATTGAAVSSDMDCPIFIGARGDFRYKPRMENSYSRNDTYFNFAGWEPLAWDMENSEYDDGGGAALAAIYTHRENRKLRKALRRKHRGYSYNTARDGRIYSSATYEAVFTGNPILSSYGRIDRSPHWKTRFSGE
jgi:hypothetical protein